MRHPAIAPVLFLASFVFIAGPTASPQDQPRPAPAQPRDARAGDQDPAGAAMIYGTVTVSGSGQPARKARVSLSGAGLRSGRTMIADDVGRFVFAALPAGRYTVRVSKPGYVNVSYGQRRPDSPGTPLQLNEGQRIEIQLQLPRGGVITGTVLDEHGEAVPGTPVRVLRYAMQSGQRTLQQTGSGSTDDRGIYRIYGLQPGDYIVAATPRNTTDLPQIDALQAEVAALRDRVEAAAPVSAAAARLRAERVAVGWESLLPADDAVAGYAPVYYPGTTAPAGAATMTVGVGEEKMGVDFSLQLVPVARVEGVVASTAGEAAQNIQVTLVNLGDAPPGVGRGSARPDGAGRFSIPNVAPGRYLVVARGTIGAPGRGGRGRGQLAQLAGRGLGAAGRAEADAVRLWAMTEIAVDGQNVTNLVLALQPGTTMNGRLVFEGTAAVPSDLSQVRVTAQPADTSGPARALAAAAPGVVDANGSFRIGSVVPGRYRITAGGSLQGWTLASSTISGQDTLDFPVEVNDQPIGGAVLTFTDRRTEITGTIVNEQGQPAPDYTVVVYPADREFWTPGSRRISTVRPGTDGRFTFRNLPPGDYRIAPVLDPEPGSWFDPSFLDQLETTALGVPLGPGEQKVQNLRIAG